jgi:hypothetical protein
MRSLVMAVLLGSCLGACGDEAASAVVDGRRYVVGVVRDISVADADLSPYATVSDTNVRSYFLDDQAYALRDVDPTTLLLVRSAPNREDDQGPWGPFVGLWGDGQDPDVCGYFERPRLAWCA